MTALSPRSDAGGTLHCPSPTSFHTRGFQIHKELERDPRLLQIQRSLSRSPSKSPIHLTKSASSSPSPSSPLSPTRNDTRNKTLSTSISAPLELQVPSALLTPHQPGTRKTRVSSRRQSPLRNPRFTITPKSPRKRTLQESSDNGNSVTRSSRSSSEDQENRTVGSVSPDRDSMSDGASKQTTATSHSIAHAPPRATARFEQGRGRSWGAKSSPLKRSERSDGLMNTDTTHMGSPSAKRRSLHGGILNSDFDIFEQAGRLDSQTDTQMSDIIFDSDRVVPREQPSPMVSRSSSLRPTTVQQRNEKPSLVRSRAHPDIAAEMATPGHVQSRNRSRQSLDSALLPMPRDSPFSSQGSLPNASAHPIPQSTGSSQGILNPRLPARHPLSRTLSQSTSTSSMAEDSPTHIPIRQPEQRRPQFNFSKTMPSGTSRPISRDGTSHSQDSSGASFATPENYKLVKPHAAAFGSTGLISKRTRNTEGSKPNLGASTSTMPDTPCKRHSIADMQSPSATAHDEIFPRGHHKGVSFGEPSTPFNPKKYHTTPASFGKGVNIFGSDSGKRLQRKDSFFGLSDVEDDSQSPSAKVESQSSTEYDIPPTPSRQLRSRLNDPPSPFLPGNWGGGRGSLTLELAFGSGAATVAPSQFCKSFSISRPEVIANGDSNDQVELSPSVGLRFEHFSSVPRSFTYSRLLRNSKSPTPLDRAAYTAPAYLARRKQAKPSPLSPASPPESRTYRLSPRTPRDHMLPPDPSGLSISQHGDEQIKGLDSLTSSASILPPATPTASKEYFALSNRSRLGATPSHKPAPVEIDSTLTARFYDIQVLGTGEFSQVFRVSGKGTTNQVGVIPRGAERRLPLPDQKWAVKKSRKAFMGPRDRQSKIKEVEILKALGKSDHTVEFIDSWEHKSHLYIQTEYCEEGSLDMFLDIKGRNARLDDFRIWKILEDLTLGLKHIHDSGYIHLDLKPANILIAFEGDLKIADFGMATSWPAQSGIEAEGDREYIGPEILQGEVDKPADIFALGLIILEIAGNVVLPDNGVSWQRLRSGDFSDVPSLTWSSESSHHILRDNDGNPLSQEDSLEIFYGLDDEDDAPRLRRSHSSRPENRIREALARASRDGELAEPPSFMRDPHHPEALDKIMRWMLSPGPSDRPVVDQLLAIGAVQWTRNRRRAGAVTYEGNWGPSDYVLSDDTEMLDV